ncbi:MAG: type III PLP-dependent enzyme [Alphaproteobacteria bacterium]|nr:type III PLP-dependent enzyme [Alphaproteobacteria bacterium]MBF0392066.1 type III PLP-dependent enzyme [Alphaproteobacteria bacterium]
MTNRFLGADAIVRASRPTDPLLLLDGDKARFAASAALRAFPGIVAYAVKVCDRPEVLRALADGGIRHWDVASIHEVRAVREQFPEGVLHFMNPVKAASHIAEAYGLGVRDFAFDCERELDKIAESTGRDPAVVPVLRVAVPNDHAKFALDGKFGCDEDEAARLLSLAAAQGYRPGVTFHVGSQCESAASWEMATDIACRAAARAGIEPSVIDIGGGYPASYRGVEPDFASCVAAGRRAMDRWFPRFDGRFQCEPGRVLVAPSASVLVRVELRKGQALHLNDGYYGLLSELKWMPGVHPVRMLRPNGRSRCALQAFSFFGPTCDSIDSMDGPYHLPADIEEGDWIEIGMMGAYSTVLAGRFNGFPDAQTVILDQPRDHRAAA